MASNLNKGYADIPEPGQRPAARPRPRTVTKKEPSTPKTPAKTSYREPKKITGKPIYERMEEKDTPSHRITVSKDEIKKEAARLHGDLDRSDKRYFALKDRLLSDEAKGTVPKGSAEKFAREMKEWQEQSKQQFRGWVDETIEKNKGNKKAPGTFNNMLEDAEEALTSLDSRPGPEKFFQVKSLEQSQRRRRLEEDAAEEAGDSQSGTNVYSNAADLVSSQTGGSGKGPSTNALKMLRQAIDAAGKKGGLSDEQIYMAQEELTKNAGSTTVRAQMETANQKLAAAPDKDKGFWDRVGDVAGGAKDIAGNVATRAIDVASRPLYAVGTATEGFLQHGLRKPEEIVGANLWEGLSGQKKMLPSQAVYNRMYPNGKKPEHWWENVAMGAGGLALDIGLDPTTYLTFGATAAGKKAAIEAAKKSTEKGVVKAVLENAPRTLRRNVVRDAAFEAKTRVAKVQNAQAATKVIDKAANKIRAAEVKALTTKGVAVGPKEMEDIYQNAVNVLTRPQATAVEAALLKGQKPRLAVRFAGRDIGELSPVGRALEAAHVPFAATNRAIKQTSFGRAMNEMFNMRAHFPGKLNTIRRIQESKGLVTHEEFQKFVDKALHGLNREERRAISHARGRGIDLTGSLSHSGRDMGDVQKIFADEMDRMWDEKVAIGLNTPTQKGDNYLFHYYRGDVTTPASKIRETKKLRKAQYRAHGHVIDLDEAKALGMKPYEDIGDVMKLMHADHQRKLSRYWYKHDVMDQFGLMTEFPDVAKANGLVDVMGILPTDLKAVAAQQGKKYYLHRDIVPTFTELDKMHSLASGEEINRFMRFMNRMTNWWKSTATVYNPGNWFNNTLGDFYLNFMDGVQNPRWYKLSSEVVLGGKVDGKIVMRLGSHNMTRGELYDLYKRYGGSAGFLRADVDEVAFRVAPTLRHKIHQGYQKREDFSRFAHFAHALRDEFTRIPKTGKTKLLSKRLEAAAEAASERVAKFNIDYSAFTPFERQVKATYVPFYSWMRKAFPLMLENVFMRPGRVSAVQKMQKALETSLGVPAQDMELGSYNVEYPQWLRDSGYMRLSGGRNPLVIRNPLPTNIFGDVFGGADFQEMLSGNLAKLHPAIQAPFELASGKQLFSGSGITDADAYVTGKFPAAAVVGAATGIELPGQPEWDWKARVGRLMGSKPYKVTDRVQAGELRRQQDSLDAQVRELNQKIYPIQVQKTSKGWIVRNDSNDRRFDKVFTDPKDAYEVALKLSRERVG